MIYWWLYDRGNLRCGPVPSWLPFGINRASVTMAGSICTVDSVTAKIRVAVRGWCPHCALIPRFARFFTPSSRFANE